MRPKISSNASNGAHLTLTPVCAAIISVNAYCLEDNFSSGFGYLRYLTIRIKDYGTSGNIGIKRMWSKGPSRPVRRPQGRDVLPPRPRIQTIRQGQQATNPFQGLLSRTSKGEATGGAARGGAKTLNIGQLCPRYSVCLLLDTELRRAK